MTASANLYANVYDQALSGNVNWPNDAIKMGLLSSAYTPNLATHVHWSDISANEISGTGYTAGGQALASKTHTVTPANSWGTSWAASTSYTQGSVIRPTAGNGYLYYAESVGATPVSGTTQPAWPTTVGATVLDGNITWTCIGESITQFSSTTSPSWSSATITAEYGVIYDSVSGVLIALINFGANTSITSGTFTVNVPGLGWFWMTAA